MESFLTPWPPDWFEGFIFFLSKKELPSSLQKGYIFIVKQTHKKLENDDGDK